jgi:hypothetical protein
MKIPIPLSLVILAAAWAAFLGGCSPKSDTSEHSAAPQAEKKNEPEPRVKQGTNGEVIVTLTAATQKMMGLQTSELAPAQLSPELKAYGRVQDPAPLAALVVEWTTASTAAEVSQAELKRLKTLAAQSNTSERALQAAQASATHDQTQVESVRLRLLASWGAALAERKDLAGFVQSLVSLASVLVQLDLPAGQPLNGQPTGARLLTLADPSTPIPAQFLGPMPSVDPQMQGRGILFLVESNGSRLMPGASVTGFITLPGEAQTGVAVPRNAIVRFNGAAWVYVQTGDETFQRVQVPLEHPLAEGWFVAGGLKPQDKVVTVAAQQVLSEELKGQGGEQ